MAFFGVIYGIIFLVILILAYLGKLPTKYLQISHYDLPGHLILYAIATYVGHLACQKRKLKLFRYFMPIFPLLFAIFTIIEEYLQALSPNRTFSRLDLLASIIGLGLGYWLAEKTKL